MDKPPRSVSVALATYCGEQFLQPLLDSVAAQTRLPDELVVCDDASTDATVAIVERFAAAAPFRVTLHRHPRNVGVLENFFSAFERATGDVILYCDQDDVWLPRKVEQLAAAFDDPDIRLAAHRSFVTDQDLVGTDIIPHNARYGKVPLPLDPQSTHVYGHQMAFDRRVLTIMQALRGDVPTCAPALANNFDAYIPFCASLAGAIHLSPDPLIRFRRHGGTVSPLAKTPMVELSRVQRLAATAERRAGDARGREQLLERAIALGLVAQRDRARLRAAYARHVAVSDAVTQVAHGALPLRLAELLRAGFQIARPRTGFSNDSRLREAMLAAAALLVRSG